MEQNATRGEGLGRLRSNFLRGLLREHTAGRLGRGLIVVTSRLPLTDIDRETRSATEKTQPDAQSQAGPTPLQAPYHLMDLERRPLNDHQVRLLLKLEGVRQVSETQLDELIQLSGRHPLALKTLANILARHNGGRAAGWRGFDGDIFHAPPGREVERHLWRVLGWTDRLLSGPERRVMAAIAPFREAVAPEWLSHLLAPGEATSSRQGLPGTSARDGQTNRRVPVYEPEALVVCP